MESEQSASADDRGGPDSGVLLAEANKVRANEQLHDSNGHQHSQDRLDAGPECYAIHGPDDEKLKPCDEQVEIEEMNRTSDSYEGGNAGNDYVYDQQDNLKTKELLFYLFLP